MADPPSYTQTSIQADRSWSSLVHAVAIRIPKRLDQASLARRRMVNLRKGR